MNIFFKQIYLLYFHKKFLLLKILIKFKKFIIKIIINTKNLLMEKKLILLFSFFLKFCCVRIYLDEWKYS